MSDPTIGVAGVREFFRSQRARINEVYSDQLAKNAHKGEDELRGVHQMRQLVEHLMFKIESELLDVMEGEQ